MGEEGEERRGADCEIAWQSQAGVMAVAEGISMGDEGGAFPGGDPRTPQSPRDS